jgi:uncharacterized protein YjbI with pentapeptide repeats
MKVSKLVPLAVVAASWFLVGLNASPDDHPCSSGQHWDPSMKMCMPDNCNPEQHWDPSMNMCMPDAPAPSPSPDQPQIAFFYDPSTKSCHNAQGQVGHNQNFFGSCGQLENSDLQFARMDWPSPPDLRGAILRGSDMSKASLQEGIFEGADLTGVNFYNADLTQANFSGATLKNVNWEKTFLNHAQLSGVDLHGQDLRTAVLDAATLKATNLSGALLAGAQLHQTDLSYSDLSGAQLASAALYSADLSHSNLSKADLRNAFLFGADLGNVQYGGTQFDGAVYDEDTSLPFDLQTAASVGMKFLTNGKPPAQPHFAWFKQNILSPRCLMCHSTTQGDGDGLDKANFDTYENLMKQVKPGDPMHSPLYLVLFNKEMPRPMEGMEKPAYLNAFELQALSDWIKAGALND